MRLIWPLFKLAKRYQFLHMGFTMGNIYATCIFDQNTLMMRQKYYFFEISFRYNKQFTTRFVGRHKIGSIQKNHVSLRLLRHVLSLLTKLGITMYIILYTGTRGVLSMTRTRQIIRYRAKATLRRLQIKQYTTSKEGGGGLRPNGNII